MAKLTRKNIGDRIEFQGFDGKHYHGVVSNMQRRIATIEYSVSFGGRTVLAYLEPKDHHRIIFLEERP